MEILTWTAYISLIELSSPLCRDSLEILNHSSIVL